MFEQLDRRRGIQVVHSLFPHPREHEPGLQLGMGCLGLSPRIDGDDLQPSGGAGLEPDPHGAGIGQCRNHEPRGPRLHGRLARETR